MQTKRTHFTLWFALIGFIFGLLAVLLATVIAVIAAGLPLTFSNLLRVNLTSPLLWLFDLAPFVFAILLGFAGSLQDKLGKQQQYFRNLTEKHSTELKDAHSMAATSDMMRKNYEQAHQQLTQDLQQKVDENSQLQAQLADQNSRFQDLEAQSKETERVISRAKRQWEATFDAVHDAIALTDADGTILRCNRALSEAFQMDYRTIVGKPVGELLLGEGGVMPAGWLAGHQLEMKIPSLDGWFEISTSPVEVENSQTGQIYVIRDVTEKKQAALKLQLLEQYYESLVKNSPIAIVTLKLDHTIVECNPAFQNLFGYATDEVLGRNLDSLVAPPELEAESLRYTQVVSQGRAVHEVTRRRRKDGSLVDVELFGIPVIVRDKQIGVLALYHNISHLVQVPPPEAAPEAPPEAAPEAEPEAALEVVEAVQPAGEPEPVTALAAIAALEELRAFEPEPEPIEALVAAAEPETFELAETAILPDLDEVLGAAAAPGEPAAAAPRTATPYRIDKIEGIGPVYSTRLAEVGIHTTEDLLNVAASRRGREELAIETGIPEKLILGWTNRADLMRIPGIGEEYSDLLEVAGVDTVKELRNRRPENLLNSMVEANQRRNLVRRLPSFSEVSAWVAAARQIEPRMTY